MTREEFRDRLECAVKNRSSLNVAAIHLGITLDPEPVSPSDKIVSREVEESMGIKPLPDVNAHEIYLGSQSTTGHIRCLVYFAGEAGQIQKWLSKLIELERADATKLERDRCISICETCGTIDPGLRIAEQIRKET